MPESSQNVPICKKRLATTGWPNEFYNTFWPLLSDILIDFFNETFIKKEMSPSQRQAMITLTKKQDKDRTCLENRRPIPLTNVDVKIASKIIATLLRKSYPKSFIAIRRSLVPLFQSKSIVRNHSDENDFDLHENETACRTHFRMKGFAVEFETEAQDTRKWTHLLRHYIGEGAISILDKNRSTRKLMIFLHCYFS